MPGRSDCESRIKIPDQRQPSKCDWFLDLLLGLLPLCIGFGLIFCTAFLPGALAGGADFRQLYTGGYMVRTGRAHDLYDFEKQLAVQQSLAPAPSYLLV